MMVVVQKKIMNAVMKSWGVIVMVFVMGLQQLMIVNFVQVVIQVLIHV